MLRYLLLLCFLTQTILLSAAVQVTPAPAEAGLPSISLEDIRELNGRELGEKLGRKLTFKERIGLSFIRGKLRRQERRAQRRIAKGKSPVPTGRDGLPIAALVCGILSFFIPLAFVFAILFGAISMPRNKYVDPSRYRMAKWGFWLGLGVLIAATFIAIFVLTTVGF